MAPTYAVPGLFVHTDANQKFVEKLRVTFSGNKLICLAEKN